MAITKAAIVRRFRIKPRETERMAQLFYKAMAAEYRNTMLELLHRHGEIGRSRVLLSPEIRSALLAQARADAARASRTINGLLDGKAARSKHLPADIFARELAGYMAERYRNRGPMLAMNETKIARLDALVAFYRENGSEPDFDFAGPPPACPICKRLRKTQPHPLATVIRIGRPHINCRHEWKAKTRAQTGLRDGGIKPGAITAGRGLPGGLLGGEPLANLAGGHDAALEQLDAMGIR
jgi:hypothetical protein